MTTPFWIGTSWKMNKTLGEAARYAQEVAGTEVFHDPRLQGFVVPPFTALAQVCRDLTSSPLKVGAQNMHWAESGAYTGEISPLMVADTGADLVELGHSERREHFGENDSDLNRKVHAALAHGLTPLLCVGETAREKALGSASETVIRQCKMALAGVTGPDLDRVLIAYEPVWAIGEGGVAASADDAAWMHRQIRAALPANSRGEPLTVLYGGSVNPVNCEALAAREEIGGLFIGRSAWRAEGLVQIAEKALRSRFGEAGPDRPSSPGRGA
ncbi:MULTISPECIES: triose-phosphate isomerase [Halomonas]|uniref:triose-phosphate isomerase n=1 Tax=Halomonas TaxID=2745 RepID=UPI001C9855F6|nr:MULTISPECIES: triose-phosphate isomerase [Halomonas]MBY6207526.1 triose-phosphate isomerase [Halomonas sp. DP3Y7-2]MBY6228335.1 triose-phosphate isomerase [Halomonas sp. DP3Y7-1]MCA0916400.1 triose-phosphate isomerase [Halomonas denitrificans]